MTHAWLPSSRDIKIPWERNSVLALQFPCLTLRVPDRFPALFAGCWFEVDAVKRVPGCTCLVAKLHMVAIEM